MTRIAVVGAGAIGGWLAARMALAGSEVMALTSRSALDHMTLEEQGDVRTARFGRFDGPADLALFAVKAPGMAAAAASSGALIGPETLILPVLNGLPWWFTSDGLSTVDPGGAIDAALPRKHVIGCVVHASCHRTAPDRIHVVHADKLIIGEPKGGASKRVAMLCDLLEGAGLRCNASEDVRRAIWYKLWGNATINPLSALTRATADKLLADPALRQLMAEAMDELAAIGCAVDCPITETAEDRMAVTARLGAFKSSMLQDVEAGRSLELEALVGAPREIAQRHGIATPQLDRIYALTKLLSESLTL